MKITLNVSQKFRAFGRDIGIRKEVVTFTLKPGAVIFDKWGFKIQVPDDSR